jgi:hypothetical protein
MVQKKNSISLSQAFEGMILSKQAEGKSINTIDYYRNSFQKLGLFFDSDPVIDAISKQDLVTFFAWLQQDLRVSRMVLRQEGNSSCHKNLF